MNYLLLVRPNAEKQIDEVYRWHQEKLKGLGDEFLNSVDSCLLTISNNPFVYSVKYKSVRMGLLKKFPYGVFYVIKSDIVVVLAVLHFGRNPKIYRKLK